MKKYFKTELIDKYLVSNNLSKTKFSSLCKISYTSLKNVYGQNLGVYITTIFKIIKVLKIEAFEFFEE